MINARKLKELLMLLRPDDSLGVDDQLDIYRDGRLVGYIDLARVRIVWDDGEESFWLEREER